MSSSRKKATTAHDFHPSWLDENITFRQQSWTMVCPDTDTFGKLFALVTIVLTREYHRVAVAGNRIYETDWFENFYPPSVRIRQATAVHDVPSINRREVDQATKVKFREYINACHQTPACLSIARGSPEVLDCIRRCVSPKCFNQIYKENRQEEGEIDLNFARFTKCFYDQHE